MGHALVDRPTSLSMASRCRLSREKDRVFARFKDDKPVTADRRELLTIPRRAGALGSRVVKVVDIRSGGTARGRTRRVETQLRAAS